MAALSIVDLLLPRPYDGVLLEGDAPGQVRVRDVVAGSGADLAGIRPGDLIVGIDRNLLRSTVHAAELLARRQIGEAVPYLVRRAEGVEEVRVKLGRRFVADPSYFFACLLGFAFFGVGTFVLRRQPHLRPAQVFFLLSVLFLTFLVCRLRPTSYSWIDALALHFGTLALLFLPACFLHFFMIFPEPIPLRPRVGQPDFTRRRQRWVAGLGAIYTLPPLAFVASIWVSVSRGKPFALISGAPAANWWILAAYVLLGFTVLGLNTRRLSSPRLRRGGTLVLVGSVFGLLPFLFAAVAFPAALHREPWRFVVLAPLALVPLTFAVAIARFQLLDIRLVLRKSLVYTVLTAALSGFYALAIVAFNGIAQGTALAGTAWFPLLFALVIVLALEPLRRRALVWADRLVYAGRVSLQDALREMEQALSAQVDLQGVVRDLVERLPQLAGLRFAGLYLLREGRLVRVAGPVELPAELPYLPELQERVAELRRLVHRGELSPLEASVPGVSDLCQLLEQSGVELLGDLASPRRRLGLVVLSDTAGQLRLDDQDLVLIDRLVRQAAVALETGLLLDERARRAELERELEIAAGVQAQLLPDRLKLTDGWQVAARCRPARHVGGDFFAQLPGQRNGDRAVVFGDVAGKGVPGALVMMAAHEAMQTLALTYRDPATLFDLANRRLYRVGSKKGFVAVGYLATSADGGALEYLVAGQPAPLVRRCDGEVLELPLAEHRLPLGALLDGGYQARLWPLGPGDLVLAFSDGATDALSPEGEPFGNARLAAALAAAPRDPDAVLDQVLTAITRFTRGAEPYDDITLVAVTRDRESTPCAESS